MGMDDDLLENELSWRPPIIDRRILKTRPAGDNVMSGITALLFLLSLAAYLRVVGKVSIPPPVRAHSEESDPVAKAAL